MTTEAELDCKHGQLTRSCNVCELESEVARQAAEIERLKAEIGVSRLAAITNKQASDLQKEIERLKSQLLEQVPAGMFIEYEEGCWEQMADNCKGATPLFHRKDYK